MKKTILVCAIAALLAGAAPAANAQDWQKTLAAGRKEGALVLASTSLSGKSAVAVMNAVNSQFGISLQLFSGRVAVALEKIQAEQTSKSYTTDMMDEGGADIALLKKSGFLESVGALPSLQDKTKFVLPVTVDPEGQVLNILGIHIFICINTNLVKPGEEPKSFQELLDPKWKGKIFLTNPLYTTAPDEVALALTKAKSGLDDAYFAKLYHNAVIGGTGGTGEAMDKLVRGEVAIAGFFAGDSALKPIQSGAPVKVLDLKEGNVSLTLKLGLIKNAPHPNADKVYINWLLSKEGQEFVTKATGLESIRNDVSSPALFQLKGPAVRLSYEDVIEADDRRGKNYLANLVGLKK